MRVNDDPTVVLSRSGSLVWRPLGLGSTVIGLGLELVLEGGKGRLPAAAPLPPCLYPCTLCDLDSSDTGCRWVVRTAPAAFIRVPGVGVLRVFKYPPTHPFTEGCFGVSNHAPFGLGKNINASSVIMGFCSVGMWQLFFLGGGGEEEACQVVPYGCGVVFFFLPLCSLAKTSPFKKNRGYTYGCTWGYGVFSGPAEMFEVILVVWWAAAAM